MLPALSVTVPNAGAQAETAIGGTLVEFATVPVDEWKGYSVSLQGGESLTYAITVTSGSRIDVYFVDDANYALYKDPFAASFQYFLQDTQENTMTVAGSFRPGGSNTYWVVVDNVDLTTTGATPSGTVAVNVSFTKVGNVFAGLLTLVVVASVIVVIIIGVYLVTRKGKQPPIPVAPPPYVPGAPGAPPQPPLAEPPRPPPSA